MDAAHRNAACLTGLHVLIVEDEPMLAICLGDVIEAEGCVVAGTVGTVAGALALVATAAFDVAILDLNLHGEPVGPIAAAIVRGGHAVVFSTGSGASDVPAEFQGWPVLCKPYSDEAVFAALASATGDRQRSIQPRHARSEREQIL